MDGWEIGSDLVRCHVNALGGQLGPVMFRVGGDWLEPMHRAPWLSDPRPADEPMLQNLQGDFFCAPFGASDVLADEHRAHGSTANGAWRLLDAQHDRLLLELEAPVAGARATKEVRIRAGQPVIYQTHRLHGGSGRIPLGHHAMLRAPEDDTLALSFSPFVWAATRPQAPEPDPYRGRSKLEYPQRLTSLSTARTVDGESVDLTVYPVLEDSEELVMLVTDPALEFAWSAAMSRRHGWIWFAVRPNSVLRNTVLWMSNGGRDYPPFSGRHRRVIGIEEVTAYFDLGHRLSAEPNALSDLGFPTSVDLVKEGAVTARYAFGSLHAPPGFEKVENIYVADGDIVITDGGGREVRSSFDLSFLAS